MTTQSQPTPGPWKTGRSDMQSYTADGAPFTNVYAAEADEPLVIAKCFGGDDLDDKANARLIAAAPEMLALIQAALIEDHEGLGTYAGIVWEMSARALLARIEGKETP